jgi:hypothetical protein
MKKRHCAEHIVRLPLEAALKLGEEEQVADVYRKLGITQQTYYRWRPIHGTTEPKLAKRLQELRTSMLGWSGW